MQGSWNNGKPHYRCVYPTEYGLANHTEHPRSVYVREELIVPTLDRWLLRAFSPTALPQTIQAIADAQEDEQDDELLARTAEAKRIIADCDQRLARYRAALEAGTDPALIACWTAEVNTTRAAAQAQLRASGGSTRMTSDEISSMVTALGSILDLLRDADPADKAKIYSGVGLKLTYQPGQNKVIAEAKPPTIMYEGSCPRTELNPNYMIVIRHELLLT
jgi:site-specific DNA recombinase